MRGEKVHFLSRVATRIIKRSFIIENYNRLYMKAIRFWLLLFAGILAASGVQAKKKDILSKEKGSITFRVDPDLPEPTGESLRGLCAVAVGL